MDCVIIAGGLPAPDDPLYSYTQGNSKALLDFGGRTSLERVVDAIQNSESIDEVVVVGLGDDMGMQFQRPVHHIPDQGRFVLNILAGVNWVRKHNPESEVVLVGAADIPAITPAIIDEFIETCRPFDHAVYFNVVTRETMETRFPGSNRTFAPLKNLRVAGGDITLVKLDIVEGHEDLLTALADARKHTWQLARIIGFGTLIKFFLRQLTLSDCENIFLRILGRPVKAIISPHAEIAMDADKPHQIDLLRAEWPKQSSP